MITEQKKTWREKQQERKERVFSARGKAEKPVPLLKKTCCGGEEKKPCFNPEKVLKNQITRRADAENGLPLNLLHYFDAVYVINLDNRPDRWKDFTARAEKSGVAGFQRYRAIEGDKCPHPAWWRAGNGAWGCLMSHLRIAQDALLDGIDHYLVLEDDVIFSENFKEELEQFMTQIEEQKGAWDMLYLGGQHLYNEHGCPTPYAEGVLRAQNINRTHAFAVNKRFMQQFSQHIMHAPDYIKSQDPAHIDHQLGLIHRRGGTLTLTPEKWMCGQKGGWSNISGRENKDQWWQGTGW